MEPKTHTATHSPASSGSQQQEGFARRATSDVVYANGHLCEVIKTLGSRQLVYLVPLAVSVLKIYPLIRKQLLWTNDRMPGSCDFFPFATEESTQVLNSCVQ